MRRCERPDLPRNGVYFSYGPLLSSFLGATTLFLPLRSLPPFPPRCPKFGVLSRYASDTTANLYRDATSGSVGDSYRGRGASTSSRRKIEQTIIQERRSLSLLRAAGAYVSRRVRVARGIERINKNDAGSAGDTVTHRFARSLARFSTCAFARFTPFSSCAPSLSHSLARILTVNRNAASPRIPRAAAILITSSMSGNQFRPSRRIEADGQHAPLSGGQ